MSSICFLIHFLLFIDQLVSDLVFKTPDSPGKFLKKQIFESSLGNSNSVSLGKALCGSIFNRLSN